MTLLIKISAIRRNVKRRLRKDAEECSLKDIIDPKKKIKKKDKNDMSVMTC